jgi:hypothetical protein
MPPKNLCAFALKIRVLVLGAKVEGRGEIGAISSGVGAGLLSFIANHANHANRKDLGSCIWRISRFLTLGNWGIVELAPPNNPNEKRRRDISRRRARW